MFIALKTITEYLQRSWNGGAFDPFIHTEVKGPEFSFTAYKLRKPEGSNNWRPPRRRLRCRIVNALGPDCSYSYAAAPSAKAPVKIWHAADFWEVRVIVQDLSRRLVNVVDIDKLFGRKHHWYRTMF